MKTHNKKGPRVILHGNAAGAITAADIERRARELATIRGSDQQPTEQDRADAEFELLGGGDDPAISTEDAESPLSASRDPSEPSTSRGEQISTSEETDETTDAERLALQGVDEAQHDQMIAAQRKKRREKS